MSSMHLKSASALVLALAALTSVPARCQTASDGTEWDHARQQLVLSQPGTALQAVQRWQALTRGGALSFDDYAGFLLAYPGYPDEARLRVAAESALALAPADASRIVAFFDRFAPVTNAARAQYALALSALRRPDAADVARTAWRGGTMSDSAEATINAQFGRNFGPDDHDARADALLWDGAAQAAARVMDRVSLRQRPLLMARLALAQGNDPATIGVPPPHDAALDLGYVYNRVRQFRKAGFTPAAINYLAQRPIAARPALDQRKWLTELLAVARAADDASAVRIAASIDDAFLPGEDISRLSFQIRDTYTSLMWLGGMKALNSLGDGTRAAALFHRYGAAARTPQTRSKGFYWAGRALIRAGDQSGARRYFEMAATYPDQFYGLLALERLGRQPPKYDDPPRTTPTAQERAAFMAKPITAAVRELARAGDWQTTVRFFREICEQAQTEADHVLIADYARQLGRRDLGVILGQAAHGDGFGNFHHVSFPVMPVPQGTNWTVVHAVTRQESQFAQNAISHAGARGLMQLMPGTAREQAGKLGIEYEFTRLTSDPAYNVLLGDAYFRRMLANYGSYPLAAAAYNAGPGNVNRWLRSIGDPRTGAVDWVEWIERIPLSETRGYVQHVLENAVVYEAMNPQRATISSPNPLSRFLGKRTPG